jgi:glycosyltransferase involved in cell wall biosynthesis
VSCLTSETEALPMVLLEAMALGKPVVAIDVGGVRNAVEDGETGLLARRDHPADFADSLLRLADDRGFAARLGARSRERQIARFQFGAHGRRLRAAVRERRRPSITPDRLNDGFRDVARRGTVCEQGLDAHQLAQIECGEVVV